MNIIHKLWQYFAPPQHSYSRSHQQISANPTTPNPGSAYTRIHIHPTSDAFRHLPITRVTEYYGRASSVRLEGWRGSSGTTAAALAGFTSAIAAINGPDVGPAGVRCGLFMRCVTRVSYKLMSEEEGDERVGRREWQILMSLYWISPRKRFMRVCNGYICYREREF